MPAPQIFAKLWEDPASRRRTVTLAAVLALLAAAALLYAAIDRKSHAVSGTLAQKTREVRTARESGLDVLGAERLAKLQKGASDFRSGFIRISEMPSMLDGISDEAEKNGVRVIGVNAVPTPEGDGGVEAGAGMPRLRRLPIAMRLEGTTRTIGNFLHALSRSSERIFVVDRLRLGRPDPKARTLEAELTLSFFTAEGAEA